MDNLIRKIVGDSIESCLPDKAVTRELKNLPEVKGRKILIAIGKAAYQMAKTALESDIIFDQAVVITKYNHLKAPLDKAVCFEAGHPISDENTIKASQYAYDLVGNLTEDDLLVMLISGGGSALFEIPLISFEEIQGINKQLLKKGADIVEINTIRKRLSKIKGGKFARHSYPAKVYNIILSDVIGNRPDMIASGPTYGDFSTCEDALNIV
ncbi:MAG: glycerate-2-kinase family protein, partial [Anaerococcus hydrogenalis]|nr:glycerate-2-kinase family protein [Anaerococcus hydrogenalis]